MRLQSEDAPIRDRLINKSETSHNLSEYTVYSANSNKQMRPLLAYSQSQIDQI